MLLFVLIPKIDSSCSEASFSDVYVITEYKLTSYALICGVLHFQINHK